MLQIAERLRGHRCREILNRNDFSDAARLFEHFRSRRVPTWNNESAALRKRHAETARELSTRREEFRTTQRSLTDIERKKLIARMDRAQAAKNATSHCRREAGDAQAQAKAGTPATGHKLGQRQVVLKP